MKTKNLLIGAAVIGTAYLLTRPRPLMANTSVAPLGLNDPIVNADYAVLQSWADSANDNRFVQAIANMSPADVPAMYSVIKDYIQKGVAVPNDLQQVFNRVMGPYGLA